jgi:hypothetical protein
MLSRWEVFGARCRISCLSSSVWKAYLMFHDDTMTSTSETSSAPARLEKVALESMCRRQSRADRVVARRDRRPAWRDRRRPPAQRKMRTQCSNWICPRQGFDEMTSIC